MKNIKLGVSGDSNMKCMSLKLLQASGSSGEVGSRCSKDLDCIYGLCTSGVCAAPPLVCPTNKLGKLYDFYP